MNARIAIALCVLMLGGVFAAGAWQIEGSGGYSGLSPRFLPTGVAIGLAACGLVLLVQALRAARSSEPAASANVTRPGLRRDLAWVLGGLIAHLLLIGFVGFIAASTLLWVCVARGYGSVRPARDAFVALVSCTLVWLLFAKGVGLGLALCPVLGV